MVNKPMTATDVLNAWAEFERSPEQEIKRQFRFLSSDIKSVISGDNNDEQRFNR